jgi:hypothetical protein
MVMTSNCCRIFWLIFVSIAIYLSCKTTSSLYDKYENAPIRIKYEDVTNGLENVPFPAITFNNELQYGYYYDSIIKLGVRLGITFEHIVERLGDDRFESTSIAKINNEFSIRAFVRGTLCNNENVVSTQKFNVKDYPRINASENYLGKIKELYQPEWFTNQSASWSGYYEPVFVETLTRRGYGFTFNMLAESKLFTDKYEFGDSTNPKSKSAS